MVTVTVTQQARSVWSIQICGSGFASLVTKIRRILDQFIIQFPYSTWPIYFAKYAAAVTVALACRYNIHHDNRTTKKPKTPTFIQNVRVNKLFSFPTMSRTYLGGRPSACDLRKKRRYKTCGNAQRRYWQYGSRKSWRRKPFA